MTRANFNITFPIADWLFGTLSTGRAPEASPDVSPDQLDVIADQ
jgi:hypothetical protein